MSALEVAAAGPEDAEHLARLSARLWADEGGGPASLEFFRWRVGAILEAGYEAVLFREGGETVGHAIYRDDADRVFLRQFFIVPAARRRGLGRAAYQALQRDWFPRRSYVTLDVADTNPGAFAFWLALGFEEQAQVLARPMTRQTTPAVLSEES